MMYKVEREESEKRYRAIYNFIAWVFGMETLHGHVIERNG